jgi:hypothetical protein
MKTSILATALLIGLLSTPSQAAQDEQPYSFKDTQLGMSLKEFQAQHLTPGVWEDVANNITYSGTDPETPPTVKGTWLVKPAWKWKPDLKCNEMVKGTTGIITRCMYQTTLVGAPVNATLLFVDGQLASIGLAPASEGAEQIQLALTEKLGTPVSIPITAHVNPGWFALRWETAYPWSNLKNTTAAVEATIGRVGVKM